MIFKDAHASIPAYIFDRNAISLATGKVTSFTPSHIDVKAPTGKMVVDVTILADGKTQTYSIEDALSVAYFGNTAISVDRDAILREIEGVKATSEQIINNMDYHREVVEKCSALLEENNPALKEKRENEERFSSLESKLDKLMAAVNKFIE